MSTEKDLPQQLCLRAYAAIQLKKYPEASSKAKEALGIRAHYPIAHHLNAFALRSMGNFKDAQYAITQAINQEQGNPHHVFLLALILWSSGDADEAEKRFQEALKMEDNLGFNLNYGVFLIHQKMFEEASALAKKLIEKRPNDERVKVIVASAKAHEWKTELATIQYRPPLPADSSDSATFTDLGKVYFEWGHYDEALAEFDRALSRNHRDSEAQRLSATVFKVKNDRMYRMLWNYSAFILSPLVMLFNILIFVALIVLCFSGSDYTKLYTLALIFYFALFIVVPIWISRGATPEEFKSIEDDRLIGDIPIDENVADEEEEIDSVTKIHMERRGKLFKSLYQVFVAMAVLCFLGVFLAAGLEQIARAYIPAAIMTPVKIGLFIGMLLFFILSFLMDKESRKYAGFTMQGQ
ncbi:MAG: tetratricopeptide repeat protein [Candidatus Eremiobacteraeota bacterium]|nr:tetratricopeptide repeat protein [Candidatus Eremiobacteraeota bacterium]